MLAATKYGWQNKTASWVPPKWVKSDKIKHVITLGTRLGTDGHERTLGIKKFANKNFGKHFYIICMEKEREKREEILQGLALGLFQAAETE